MKTSGAGVSSTCVDKFASRHPQNTPDKLSHDILVQILDAENSSEPFKVSMMTHKARLGVLAVTRKIRHDPRLPWPRFLAWVI